METNYKTLNREYNRLCEVSEKFRKTKDVTVDIIIKRYHSHLIPSIGLDIARDAMYFNDYNYKVKNKYEKNNYYSSYNK